MTRLKEFRLAAGLTQQQLAAMLDVDQGAVSHWETGTNLPVAKYRRRLSALFRVTEAELFGKETDE